MRLRRRLDLDIAAARGLYTFVRPILVTLACRAASTAALRGLSPLSRLRLQRLLPLLLPAAALQRALLLHPDLLLLLAHHPRLAQADGDRQAPLPGAPLRQHELRLLPLLPVPPVALLRALLL